VVKLFLVPYFFSFQTKFITNLLLKAAIEACLLHGLKKISIFQTNTTLSLLQKIGRHSQDAEKILKMCEDYDKAYCTNTNNTLQQTTNPQLNVSQSEKSSFALFSR
jgi:flagellar biosynthesis chaperone FliJ